LLHPSIEVRRSTDRLTKAALGIILAAIALRVWVFAAGRSLWIDEAMVALNIVHLPLAALLGPLEFNQIAPVGWLLLEKASYMIDGHIDYSLRAVSFLAGLLAVILFYRFMAAATGLWEALVGVALFGLTTSLIDYSATVKPYILDALFSVVFLHLALAMLRLPERRLPLTAAYAGLGLLCVLLAFGGTIAMAATGIVLFVASLVERDRQWSLLLAGVGCFWALAFGATCVLIYARNAATISNMTDVFWSNSFAPLPTSLAALAWYPKVVAEGMHFLLPLATAQLVIILFVLGCAVLAGRDPWLLALLLVPFLLALLVSGLGVYPFAHRFLLFLAPPLILAVSVALVAMTRSNLRPAFAAAVLFALVGAGPLVVTLRQAAQVPPFPIEEIKVTLAHLARHYRPGDAIVLNQPAEVAYAHYARAFGLQDRPFETQFNHEADASCIYEDIAVIEAAPRAWILLSHVTEEDLGLMVRALGHAGRISVAKTARGTTLYEFERAPGPTDRILLPAASTKCAKPREGAPFLEAITAKNRLH
jgi:hypothetical protein